MANNYFYSTVKILKNLQGLRPLQGKNVYKILD